MERVRKLVFVAANAKLERADFSNQEDKDITLLLLDEEEDDVPNEHNVVVERSSV